MADYLKWQLKILYEFNSQKDFRVIIVDNSFELNSKDYNKYPNLEVIQGDKTDMPRSTWHCAGLDRILKEADSEFFLAQDPDFFWLKKDYLKWFEGFLEDNRTVGAEYFSKGRDIIADAHFPAAYGCAFHLSDIQHLKFEWGGHLPVCFDKYGKDVGWQMRKELTDKPYVYFEFLKTYNGPKFGNFGWRFHFPIQFSYEGEIVAVHMMRGLYTPETKIIEESIPDRWKAVRNAYGKHFYNLYKV